MPFASDCSVRSKARSPELVGSDRNSVDRDFALRTRETCLLREAAEDAKFGIETWMRLVLTRLVTKTTRDKVCP